MKLFKKTTIKKALLTCLAVFTTTICAALGVSIFKPTTAKAEGTISSNVFQTDGASVRVFDPQRNENGEITYKETSRQGIRFHVEMGAGYAYGGQSVLNTAEKYERGSYKITEGFKTYTIVLPTRLLSGDLTVTTDKVLKIETTEYWFSDDDGNWESVAYIYNVPEKWYTDAFSYRGVVCTVAEDGTETVVATTDVAERSLAWVAKQAYNDTIDESYAYWGTADQDNIAAPLIKKFVPTYSITYIVNGTETTEEVLWGDTPKSVPTNDKGAWFDTKNNEEVDVTAEMTWTANRTLVLETTTSTEFVLTGVAEATDFAVTVEDVTTTYNGFKVFATLPRTAFANKTQMDIKAVNVAHVRGGEVLSDGFELQGVWTLEAQNSLGEWQMLLFFAIDAELETGDQIVIKGDSVFYANNIMYKLTEDYTIDYTEVNETVDYGMYLGDLYNSDVKGITNCAEDNTGNNGKPNEFTVRVEFYEDVMINGEFTFEFGPDSDTTKYPYPVYIQCGEDATQLIPVSGGRYYWNEGNHKILELIGAGDYENMVFGWHNGDKLYGAPGTIVKQNGGYYIFKDEMYSYFLTNGDVDAWGYALGDWVVGTEKAQYATSEFAAQGTVTEINDNDVVENEIRITTASHWFSDTPKVSILTTENMSETEPYAVYRTAVDGTVTEIEKVRYHGTPNGEGGYFQILGFCDASDFAVGDIVTIAAGARFWLGTEYYTVTDKITYYYTGSFWAQNFDVSTMGELSSANFGERAHNQGAENEEGRELRMYFTAPLAGYTETDGGAWDDLRIGTGSVTFNGTPVAYVRYQRWDANSTWLSFGGYIGKVALGDTLVIEAGTTIWSASNVAYEFTEQVEWIYAEPNSANASVTWSRVLGGVTVDTTATNATIIGSADNIFAVGNTYTIKVEPNDGYLISSVIVNSKELPLTADNKYAFTVEQMNTIAVNAVVGHKVYFTVPDGATVNGGAIANGGFVAVASGSSLDFTVAVGEGYKLLGVSNATGSNGTYTVTPTADTTVTVSVEKLYQVTYANGTGYTIGANVGNGDWVDNGTTVTFTVQATSGYVVTAVSGATKSGENTYVATVNGTDINVTATTVEVASMRDITNTISIENWGGAQDGADNKWFVIKPSTLDEYMIPVTEMQPASADGSIYWNDHLENTAHNYGVDPMEYICIDGVSIRALITENASTNKYTGTTFPFNVGGVYAPITLEMGATGSAGLWMKVMTDFATSYEITVKAGFTFNSDNGPYYVSEDVTFVYDNGAMGSKYSTVSVDATNASVSGIENGATIEYDQTYSFTASAASGYQLTSVTIDGVEQGTGGSYSFTASGSDVAIVVTAKKLYAVTWDDVDNATISVSANGNTINSGAEVVEGTSISVTVTANDGYAVTSVTANDTPIENGGTYTVSSATTIAATAKKAYTVTATMDGNAVLDATSKTVAEGESVTFNITVPANAKIQANNQDVYTNSTENETTYTHTVSNVTANTSVAFTTLYEVVITQSNATVSGVENGWYKYGTTVTPTVSYSGYMSRTFTINGNNHTSGNQYKIEGKTTINASSSSSCIVEGTLITLADGTQKAVENLTYSDKLLAFNHLTGQVEVADMAVLGHEGQTANLHIVINLTFSDGTQLRIVGAHGLYDMTLNKYVFLTSNNAREYVGHTFYAMNYVDGAYIAEMVVLTDVIITEEVVRIFSPSSYEFMNCFAEGLLNVTGTVFNRGEFVNMFEFNDDLTYNIELMEADIAKYGLYTYEDFAEYMPYEVFEKLPFDVLKVSVGKGMITWEEILVMLEDLQSQPGVY